MKKRDPFMGVGEVEWKKLLHQGKWANAHVYQFSQDGEMRLLKTFSTAPFLVRWTLGLFFTTREYRALQNLKGIKGVPEDVRRVGPFSLHYRFLEGKTLTCRENKKNPFPRSYFIAAEKLIDEIHARNQVHLDLRRGENWLVLSDGTPGFIDFQSMISVRLLPPFLRKKLFAIDCSGIYKFWEKYCEVPLDAERKARADRVNRLRKFWVFQGYALQKARKRRKNKR